MRRTLKAVAILATIELLIMNVLAMAQAAPRILLIACEPLNPGAEAQYDRIESQTAVLAQEMGCPHPYLALSKHCRRDFGNIVLECYRQYWQTHPRVAYQS
jgi:hypothetical protein